METLGWDDSTPTNATALKDYLLNFKGTIADPPYFPGKPGDEGNAVISRYKSLTVLATTLVLSHGSGCKPWQGYYATHFLRDLEQKVKGKKNLQTSSSADVSPSKGECDRFMKYSAVQLLDHYKKTLAETSQHSGSYLSFTVDELPAFQDLRHDAPGVLGSWRHLLQANLLNTFSEAAAGHLARLNFEQTKPWSPDPSYLQLANLSEPEAVVFPFFVSGCVQGEREAHSVCIKRGDQCPCNSACNNIVDPYLSVGAVLKVSLKILHRLSTIALGEDEEGLLPFITLPPAVVAMTFTGKVVRVFVVPGNRPEDNRSYESNCVWTGDMTILQDVVELEVICKNISTWAALAFRRWSSNQVTQWRSRFPQASTEEEDVRNEQIKDLTAKFGRCHISGVNGSGTRNKAPHADTTAPKTPRPHTPNTARASQTHSRSTSRAFITPKTKLPGNSRARATPYNTASTLKPNLGRTSGASGGTITNPSHLTPTTPTRQRSTSASPVIPTQPNSLFSKFLSPPQTPEKLGQ